MVISQLTKTRFKVECDQCKKIFQKCKSQLGDGLHFCSKGCVKLSKLSGGKIAEKIARTNLEKYGCENVFASKDIKEKIKSTLIDKYGVDNPQKNQRIRNKSKATCLEKYGVDNPAKAQIIKDKESHTHKAKSKEQKEKSLEKRKLTNLKKYGVAFPMQISKVKEAFDWSSAYKKSIETKKKNKTGTWSSKIEVIIKDALCEIFGKDDIQEQVKLNNRWTVDFYVMSQNLYLQVDGVYWHGLDRPIDIIKEFKSSKDRRILQTFIKDREQDQWAKTNNIKLFRITDEEITIWQKMNELLKQIQIKLNQSVVK
jgi:hypothetical protein